jgi:hypothetical protein
MMRQVARLGKTNYSTWMPQMSACLAEQKVWFIVSGKDTRPSDAAQAVVWCDKAAAAAGAIYRVLEPGQRVHVAGVEIDPVKMWEKLAAVHVQKISGVRFNTLDALLAIRKSPDESLPSMVARVDFLLQDLKSIQLTTEPPRRWIWSIQMSMVPCLFRLRRVIDTGSSLLMMLTGSGWLFYFSRRVRLSRHSCASRPLLSSSLDVRLAHFAMTRVERSYPVSGRSCVLLKASRGSIQLEMSCIRLASQSRLIGHLLKVLLLS